MFGSSVLPDLLDTMQIVRLRSTWASIALICAGSVESSTCNVGKPLILPKVMRSTSGQRLDPPIPSSSACLNLAFFTSAATFLKPLVVAHLFFDDAHPAQPLTFVASGPYRGVTLPETPDLIVLLPIVKARVDALLKFLRQPGPLGVKAHGR